MKQFLLTFSLLLVFMLNLRAEAAEETCTCDPMVDRAALVALYNSAGGASWTNPWDLSQPMDTWYGVFLNSNGCVSSLNLSSNQLSGNIPPELGNLTNLNYLYLYNNQLSGNIPPELGNLDNVIIFHLSSNQLTGTIPPELGNLGSVEQLRLNSNQLTGNIPIQLEQLMALKHLGLSYNQLTGNIPPELGNLIILSELRLENNQLTGSIPSELGNLVNLKDFRISNNQIMGMLPPELGQWINLEKFYANNNQLSGCFPAEYDIFCTIGPIFFDNPDLPNDGNFLAFCRFGAGLCAPACSSDSLALVALYNATDGANWTNTWNLNNRMSTWDGVGVNATGCVTCLDLDGTLNCDGTASYSGNNMIGTLPTELGNLSNLTALSLGGNQISGTIPVELGNLSQLTILNLNNNDLSGSIPSILGSLSDLAYLNLRANQLSGSIPLELGSLNNLLRLDLSNNNSLSGSIPPELGNLSSLTSFTLSNNQLSGNIPATLGNLSNLEVLSLNNNPITGSIPSELGDLDKLTSLYLNSMQLSGSIPAELGNLISLKRLYIFDNQLSGSLPSELSNLSNLTHLYLQNNQLEGCFPAELNTFCDLGFNLNIGVTGYNFTNNPDLPGGGDFAAFCANETGVCEDNTLTFIVENTCGSLGTSTKIPVSVNYFTNVNGFQYSVHVDPNLATITGVSDFGLENWGAANFTIDEMSGTITVTWEADNVSLGQTVADGTVIFNIDVEMIGAIGSTGDTYIDGNPTPIEVLQDLAIVTPVLELGTLCVTPEVSISGMIYTYDNQMINGAELDVAGDWSDLTGTDVTGEYEIANIPTASSIVVTPFKETDTDNGVSIADVVTIKLHILQVAALGSPYKIIAADANGDDVVSTVDLVFIKRVIRQEIPEFPIEKSWRFVPHDYTFPTPTQPFPFPENRSYNSIQTEYSTEHFIGIKIGDVNGSVDASL